MIIIKRKNWLPVIIWVALFLLIFNIANYFQEANYALINAAFETLSNLAIFYFTVLVLFPRFYRTGRSYFWVSFIFLIVTTVVLVFIDHNFITDFRGGVDEERPPVIFHYFRYFFSSGFTYFVATSLSLMEQTRELQESEKVLTKEKLETELKLLKAQINPHFIFNALNNIYSLTYMQSKNAPDSILKLSEMLRYVIYDCNKDRVPLSAELKYIENFTAFQQMKSDFEQNISMKTELNGANVEIAPMLFVPLIENAFKYSRIEENAEAYITIEMRHLDSQLHFGIKNSLPKNIPASGSGMGIENVKHRLDIIYPGKYELEIEEQKDSYSVDLKIEV
jgi:sensor histidine kinase YesM